MDKNWLIRTKSNHILGPVSKEKVLDLYQNGSIKPDDELCSGNGYWFFVRETDLVERFLRGSEVQSFNPISEAQDVLTTPSQNGKKDFVKAEDVTLVEGYSLSMIKNATETAQPAASPGPEDHPKLEVARKETSPDSKKKNDMTTSHVPRVPLKKQNFLRYLAILGFMILFSLIYFRKTIIQGLFEGEVTESLTLFSEAHAQEDVPGKKKSF